MKKVLILAVALLVGASMAMAQATTPFTSGTYTDGTGIPFNIDKLGAHQNGGRGCVGCHAPHSGGRGNGGTLTVKSVYTDKLGGNDKSLPGGTWSDQTDPGNAVMGDEVLWGQDLGPVYGQAFDFPDTEGGAGSITITSTSPERMITGVAMCLSCHDGNVAKGAMMTNQSFEQAAGLLPSSYGSQKIPTLLGDDGGDTAGNYKNDHPVGPNASLGAVGHGAINAAKGFFALDANKTKVAKATGTYTGSQMAEFEKNYGLPTITAARAGAGFAVESSMNSVDEAYVVCTTCHTPHSMYTTSMQIPQTGAGYDNTKPTAKGTYPTYFFIAAPYNPGANVASGTKASSATQFCRQCHFSGPGGANEASGISIPTAF